MKVKLYINGKPIEFTDMQIKPASSISKKDLTIITHNHTNTFTVMKTKTYKGSFLFGMLSDKAQNNYIWNLKKHCTEKGYDFYKHFSDLMRDDYVQVWRLVASSFVMAKSYEGWKYWSDETSRADVRLSNYVKPEPVKDGRYYFGLMTDVEQNRLLRAWKTADSYFRDSGKSIFEVMRMYSGSCISSMFSWASTKEGHVYWQNIWNRLEGNVK